MNKLFTKITPLCMGLAMVIGVGIAVSTQAEPNPVHAASANFVKLTTSIQKGDKVLITTKRGSKYFYLPAANTSSAPVAKQITITNDSISDVVDDSNLFTVGVSSSGNWTFQNSEGGFLYNTSTNNGIRISSSGSTNEYTVTANSSETGYIMKNTSNSRYVGVYNDQDWRCYTSQHSNYNGSGELINFYVVDTPSATYTVSFNPNDGSGTMADVTGVSGNYVLPSCGFKAPDGKVFAGWKAENSGDTISAGSTFTVESDTTFYAQWANSYSVTYIAGTHGSGNNFLVENQPEGSYTLLPFKSLGMTADDGYSFKNYTVDSVVKNPGDTIELTANATVTVNFDVKPLETTYDFTENFETYSKDWGTSYSERVFSGKDDLVGDYDSTVTIYSASKQASTITNMPVIAVKTETMVKALYFELNEPNLIIDSITVTFVKWGSRTPTLSLFEGTSVTGTSVDSVKMGSNAEETLSASGLDWSDFTIGYIGNASNNYQVGIKSIAIGLKADVSESVFNSLEITQAPAKTTYFEGDSFNTTGLEVVSHFTVDGVDEDVTISGDNLEDLDFKIGDVSIENGSTLNFSVGTHTVEVSYTDIKTETTHSDEFEITINQYIGVSFTKVTSDLKDWRGTYLIVFEDENANKNYIFNGNLDTLDAAENKIDVEYGDVIRTSASNTNVQYAAFVIDRIDGGYSIKSNKNVYIGAKTYNNELVTDNGSAILNTITWSVEDEKAVITSSSGTTLCFNTASNQMRFRYFKEPSSTIVPVALYKLDDNGYVAEANQFSLGFNTKIGGACDPTGVANNITSDLWAEQKSAFEALSVDAQGYLARLTAKDQPDVTKQDETAVSTYNYIIGKYGQATYSDFMSRIATGTLSNYRTTLFTYDNNNTITFAVVVIVAVSMIAGLIIVSKKRKELYK